MIHNHFAYTLFPPVPISPLGLDKVRSQGFRMENENSHSVPCNAGGHKMYHPKMCTLVLVAGFLLQIERREGISPLRRSQDWSSTPTHHCVGTLSILGTLARILITFLLEFLPLPERIPIVLGHSLVDKKEWISNGLNSQSDLELRNKPFSGKGLRNIYLKRRKDILLCLLPIPGRSTGKSIFNGCPDCLFPRSYSYHYPTSLVFIALATAIHSLSTFHACKTLSKEEESSMCTRRISNSLEGIDIGS
ncbi:hypothetical protein HKD37_17G048198 [Glycine soja]